jgi:hypothetical protein
MTVISPQNQPTATVRSSALKRLELKRALVSHVVSYVVINAFVLVVWLVSDTGYFWPAWMMAAWGVGLVFNIWDVYGRRPITEEDIEAEVGHTRRHSGRL